MDLKTTEAKVFLAIKENNSLSIREVSKELGLSHATVERALKALKEAGYLKRTGSTRGVWSILK